MNTDDIDQYNLTTGELAKLLRVKPQTIRKRYAATGSYFGLRPIKLPNRYLIWPDDARERLLNGCSNER